jgi:hypothetical protein
MAEAADPFGTIISILVSRYEVTPFGSITRAPLASSFVNPRVSSTGICLSTSNLTCRRRNNARGKKGNVVLMGAHDSVVGWGTMLQAGRSRVLFPMR